MSEKMKRKLVSFYNRNKVLGYFFIVIAAFIIVVRKRRAHRKSIYGVRQRKTAIIMIGIIAMTSIFPSSSMVILNETYGATAGAALEWDELNFEFGIINAIFDEAGNMYLYDATNKKLRKYDKTGQEVSDWAEPTVGNYSNKIGLCFSSKGEIVTSREKNTEQGKSEYEVIFLNQVTGEIIKELDIGGVVTGCICDAEGCLYVSAYVNNKGCIRKYKENNELQWSVDLVEDGFLRGLCMDNEGNLYSTSEGKKFIAKIQPDGTPDSEFGTDGKLFLDGKFTTSGKEISGWLGDASFCDGNLYQCCYGDKLVIKISENGKVLDEVASGIGPRNFLTYNNEYIIINRDGDTGKIQKIGTPNIDVQKENFTFSIYPTNIVEGSNETATLSIRSDSEKNYKVKAKLYKKSTGEYVSDVTSSVETLQDGDADIILTPSADGWKKGIYEIQLEFSDTLGSMTLTDTINVNFVIGVGYYQVEYILENVSVEPRVEYIEKVNGQDSYEIEFQVIPEENYVLENVNVSGGEVHVERQGEQITISGIQSNIKVHIIADEEQQDTTPPIISGVEDKGIYCEKQKITVWDEELSRVTVNDKEITLDENNQYELVPARGVQTVKAVDAKGNTTTIQVTINDGHTFDEWVVTRGATCTEGGEKKHICKVCGYEESEKTDALGHDWEEEYTIDKKPTMKEPGLKSIHCRRCEAIKDQVEIIPGQISFTVISQEGAPEVNVITTIEELSTFLFTEEEWERILYGEDGLLILRVKDVSEMVSEKEKEFIQQKLGQHILAQYLDISLYKKIGNNEEIPIYQTNHTIKFTLQETNKPSDTQEQTIGKTFMIGVHGEETYLYSDLDEEDGTITIETDKFSTYAIAYEKFINQEEDTTKEEESGTREEESTTKNDNTTVQQEENTTPKQEESTTQKPEETTLQEPEIEKNETGEKQLETTTKEPPSKKKKEKKEEAAPVVPQKKNPVAVPPKTGDETPVLWLFIMEMIVGAGIYILCCNKQKKKAK